MESLTGTLRSERGDSWIDIWFLVRMSIAREGTIIKQKNACLRWGAFRLPYELWTIKAPKIFQMCFVFLKTHPSGYWPNYTAPSQAYFSIFTSLTTRTIPPGWIQRRSIISSRWGGLEKEWYINDFFYGIFPFLGQWFLLQEPRSLGTIPMNWRSIVDICRYINTQIVLKTRKILQIFK